MRVLLTNEVPFRGSGSGASTFDLANGLLAAGHQVQCLVVDVDSQGEEPFAVERVVCRAGDPDADLPFDLPSFVSHPTSRNTFAQLTTDQIGAYRERIRKRLDRAIVDFNPHIIHSQHVWMLGQLALETGVPYVVSAQGPELTVYADDSRYRQLAEQAAENAGTIIAPSDFVRRQASQLMDGAIERCETLPSAIDARAFQVSTASRKSLLSALRLPDDCGAMIAFAGALVPSKGVDVLLNAAAIYEIDPLEISTVIAGEGPQRPELEAQAACLGLRRTHFVGGLQPRQLADLFQAADLVVVPSRCEPVSRVALEAMVSGTPVIGTQAGALPEIIFDPNGALVPPADHEMLALKLLEGSLKNWKKSKGPAARQYVLEHRSLDAWITGIVRIYEQVLTERFGKMRWE